MMKKEYKILLNFGLYVLTFLVIIAIGVTKIFALEYNTSYADTQTYYDNFGSSASLVGSTWNSSLQAYVSNSISTTANSYGALVVFNSPIAIIANHTYTLSFSFLERYNIAVSSKPRVAIGTSIDGTKYNYVNGQYYSTTLVDKVVNSSIIQYVFTASGGANYIAIPWTTTSNSSQTYVFNTIIIEDLGSEGISETTINNSLANQTNTINNYIQNSTNTITNNSNANRDSIINNQNANNEALIENDNANTDKIIEENKKNFNDCRDSVNLFNINGNVSVIGNSNNTSTNISVSNNVLTSNINANLAHGAGQQFTNLNGKNFTFSAKCIDKGTGTGCYMSIYDNKAVKASKYFTVGNYGSITYTATSDNIVVAFSTSAGTGAKYTDIQVELGSTRTAFEEYGKEICVNKLDQQTNAINGLNDNINDDNTDGATSKASEFFSDFNTNTFGLTSIITAPLNLIQSLTSKTCSSLHLPLPYLNNKYLDLPCMSTIYSEHFGLFFTLYQTITYGIIAYWVCVRIFNHVKDFKNPEHDEIEVVDL